MKLYLLMLLWGQCSLDFSLSLTFLNNVKITTIKEFHSIRRNYLIPAVSFFLKVVVAAFALAVLASRQPFPPNHPHYLHLPPVFTLLTVSLNGQSLLLTLEHFYNFVCPSGPF